MDSTKCTLQPEDITYFFFQLFQGWIFLLVKLCLSDSPVVRVSAGWLGCIRWASSKPSSNLSERVNVEDCAIYIFTLYKQRVVWSHFWILRVVTKQLSCVCCCNIIYSKARRCAMIQCDVPLKQFFFKYCNLVIGCIYKTSFWSCRRWRQLQNYLLCLPAKEFHKQGFLIFFEACAIFLHLIWKYPTTTKQKYSKIELNALIIFFFTKFIKLYNFPRNTWHFSRHTSVPRRGGWETLH